MTWGSQRDAIVFTLAREATAEEALAAAERALGIADESTA
jgi:hypothetical protein